MKHTDKLKYKRAFTEMPPELPEHIELAFKRGEIEMKRRHKLLVTLSAAAACVVLLAGLALAAGQLTRPRPDVVAARGSGSSEPSEVQWAAASDPEDEALLYYTGGGEYYHTNPHCMGMRTAEAHTMPEALASGKQPCPTCVETLYYYRDEGRYYHSDAHCSGMHGAVAHTMAEALASGKEPCPVCVDKTVESAARKLLEVDPLAGKSGQVWLYLSGEANAAWAFCAYAEDADGAIWKGSAWFIGEKECVCLGHSDSVESWFFFTQHPGPVPKSDRANALEPQSGSYVGYGPELFSSRIRKGNTTVVHFWMIGEDGLPLELDTGNGLAWVEVYGGVLVGARNGDDSDWVFLHAHDQLYQVSAQVVSVEETESLPGVKQLLNELESSGYTVADCLYRDMNGNSMAPVAITVNLERDGADFHTYLMCRDRNEDLFDVMRGWDDDITVYPGRGTINPDAGLPTLASATLRTDLFIQKTGRG